MSDILVKKNALRFIVPFFTQKRSKNGNKPSKKESISIIDEILISLISNEKSPFELNLKKEKLELLPFINDVFVFDKPGYFEVRSDSNDSCKPTVKEFLRQIPSSKQAVILKLKDGIRQSRYGSRFDCSISVKDGISNQEIIFRITEIEFYVFRTEVGFLIFDVELDERATLDDALELIDRLKRFHPNYKTSFIKKKRQRDNIELTTIMTSNFVDTLFDEVEQNLFGIFKIKRDMIVTSAIVYSYFHLDSSAESGNLKFQDITGYLFWLRQVHKKDHLPAPEDLKFEDNPTLFNSYENIMFGFSTEGGSLVSLDRGQQFTDNQFREKALSNYFYLYMIVLHQVYATYSFSIKVSESFLEHKTINKRKRENLKSRDKKSDPALQTGLPENKSLQVLRDDILDFLLNSWFPQVSTRRKYNLIYERWHEVFRTGEIFRELKSEVDELDEYFTKISLKKQEEILNRLTVWLVPIGLLFGFWGINYSDVLGTTFSGLMPFGSIIITLLVVFYFHFRIKK